MFPYGKRHHHSSQVAKWALDTQDVSFRYANAEQFALQKVSFAIGRGEKVALIGPNGAGKSTVFKTIYGFLKARKGQVLFKGQDITKNTPQMNLRAGISNVPQLRSVFPQMTVWENLEMGMYIERNKKRIAERIDYVLDLFPRLAERRDQMAGTMSGGEQRMLEIGRSLMLEPKLVLMDEPSAGLAPVITRAIFKNIRRLNKEIGLTILMIEQNARQGLEISDRGYVLELGENSYEDTGQNLINNAEVRRAFLGG